MRPVDEARLKLAKHGLFARIPFLLGRQQLPAVVPDRAIVRLYNIGKPFDPARIVPPSFDGSRDGGFGVFMIANSVEHAEYFRDAHGRNGLTLVKYRREEG